MRSGPATRTAFASVNLTSAWPRSVPFRSDVATVPMPALSCEDTYAPENAFASDHAADCSPAMRDRFWGGRNARVPATLSRLGNLGSSSLSFAHANPSSLPIPNLSIRSPSFSGRSGRSGNHCRRISLSRSLAA